MTAGHVVTCRHADTLEPLIAGDGAVPDNLLLKVLQQRPRDGQEATFYWEDLIIPLYESGYQGARWIHHPGGLAVDIAAVEVTDTMLPGHHRVANDPLSEYYDFEVEAADDAFILGYPRNLTGGGQLPVWKHGTIASDASPMLPFVLIDAASREGMSGGPVIARRIGIVHPRGMNVPDGEFDDSSIIGQAMAFLGVYSGRLVHGDDALLAQIGRVVLVREIETMISSERYWEQPD